ncbi:hyccin-like [Acanthaster planci]|uniref:Hyccin-like n=1 Tax=Acanthaster planci TaxID=133434 RepID=A0A8B7ZXE7_ACAPL|nr:hyccin-like [Acanthaster planci]XP_022110085.1 hyccin-like [Acanthaster planci]XP_022110086.1 hyccin-like [Acanthaster planci]XP_022110087.1 hyccin-like [Acanthaster planci]
MAEKKVQNWLTEYKFIDGTDVATFCGKIKNDVQLIKSIYEILQEPHSSLQEPVCGQLYEFYRSGHFELKRFCLQFVPAVIWIYLRGLALHKNYGRAESLLLGIYNMEVVEPDGISRIESFTVPTLAKPSIYHEPVSQLALTENVLSYQQSNHRLVTRGPLSQVNALTIKNRFSVLTHVMSEYNADIGFLSPVSHAFFCKICSNLVLCGFSGAHLAWKQSSSSDRVSKHNLNLDIHKTPRIPLDSTFMLEMLTGIYFVMFNGQASAGIHALEDIHFRANYELYADVLLVSNAIKHSLDTNPSGRPSDGPVGINVAVTPPSPVVKRSAITNASFKTRRQKETTITVTIEGVEKTEALAKRNGLSQEPSTNESASVLSSTELAYPQRKTHAQKCAPGVDVTIVDQSGSMKVETVEMEEVRLVLDVKQTKKDRNECNLSEASPDYPEIVPVSHVRELHSATHRSSNSSGESLETNL